MRRLIASLSAAALCAAASVPAHAATSIFTGTVLSTCVIGPVGTPGLMQPSVDLKKLSSKDGGTASTMALVTTGGVKVKVSPTVDYVPVANDVGAITWSPTFAISGTHAFPDGNVDRTLAGAGADTVTVNLEGTKSGANTFSAGVYVATVTITCEPG